jgi:two-component system phosphate regulon sensor histidine kinase PhoR
VERPSFGRVLRAATLIGAAPVLALLALLAAGQVAPASGIAALLACTVAATGLAWIWIGDLSRLAEALRRAATAAAMDDENGHDGREAAMRPSPPPPVEATPLLPAAREVAFSLSRLARDLAERRSIARRLRRADEAIVEGLPDPLLVLSSNRALLRANAAARTLFAAGEGGLDRLGGDVAALLRHPVLADAVDRALAERKAQSADLVLPVPVPRELLAQVTPVEPALAGDGRVVVLLSDRTRERAVERMRADFVANASHELRTPLASLIGFIETLRGPAEDDPAARARFLAIMAEQSERMRRLIDDLLGLSRIELTEHQPPVGRAPVADIARSEAAALEPLLRRRSMTLSEALDEAGWRRRRTRTSSRRWRGTSWRTRCGTAGTGARSVCSSRAPKRAAAPAWR